MKKLEQKGFGFFYWLLILLLLALLGFAGWYVWKKKNAKPKDNAGQSQQQQAATTQPIAESNYLVIKEWDVRVKLTDTTTDAYYLIKPDTPNYAYLSLDSLKNTACAADKTTLGAYTRINNLTDVNNDSAGADGQTYAQMGYSTSPNVGDKYFYYSQPQSFCSGNEAQDQAYWDEFKTILNSVEATP